MKLAHISDLHLNSFFRNSNLKAINDLLKYALRKDIDHLVITGDLTDNARHSDFKILRGLLKSFDLLKGERLSMVIGNHDIFGGIQTAEDIFSFPKRCRQINYRQKVEEFVNYFGESFESCVYLSGDYFPFAKLIDGILINGLNSNAEYSRIKNPFASNGAVGEEQINETEFILRKFPDVKAKIMLIHHHFNKIKTNGGKACPGLWQNMEKHTMKLRKKKRLLNLFNIHGVDLVLHGHYHENREYYRKGIRFLNAGASVKNSNHGELHMNFIEINSEVITEIHQLLSGTSNVIYSGIKERIASSPGINLKTAVNY